MVSLAFIAAPVKSLNSSFLSARSSNVTPLRPSCFLSRSPAFPKGRRSSNMHVPSTMRLSGGSMPPAPIGDRVLSMLPYLIPLLDSLSFGKYVFAKVPLLGQFLLAPLFPLYNIYRGVPFLAFGVFLTLYLLVVRNTSVSRFVRFNTYQALILDIALIFPQLFQGVQLGGVVPSSVVEVCTTAVFYAVSLAISYAVVTNARGRVPDEIPGVSDSVYQQMGPY